MAWLDAAPIPKQKNPRVKAPKPVQRRKLYGNRVPDLEYGDLILQYFLELIPSAQDQNGIRPLDFAQIREWADMTGVPLTPDKALLLRDLSVAYVSQYSLSLSPECPAPYQSATIDREHVAAGTKRFFAGLKANKRTTDGT